MDGEGHGAGFFTCPAGYAAVLFPMNLHQAEAVEPAIDCPQRAQILAKRAVNLYGEKQKEEQYSQLPEK